MSNLMRPFSRDVPSNVEPQGLVKSVTGLRRPCESLAGVCRPCEPPTGVRYPMRAAGGQLLALKVYGLLLRRLPACHKLIFN